MTLSLLRDISIVWLSIQCFVMLLIPLAILYFVVRGVNSFHHQLHGLVKRAQVQSQALQQKTETVATQVSAPVIKLQRTITRVDAVFQQLDTGLKTATKTDFKSSVEPNSKQTKNI